MEYNTYVDENLPTPAGQSFLKMPNMSHDKSFLSMVETSILQPSGHNEFDRETLLTKSINTTHDQFQEADDTTELRLYKKNELG